MKRNMLLAMAAFTMAGSALASTPAVKAGDPAKGKVIAETVCAACHGADGNSAAAANPTLAGQHPKFLYDQLQAFKSGKRKNAVMMGMASPLSDDDMRNVAAYFGEQKRKPREAADKAVIEQGKQIYRVGLPATKVPACMACHGPDGKGLPDKYPALGSQHAGYVVTQLNNYKAGTERQNSIMHDVAMRLSDAEMKAVAEYISGLR